MQKLLEKPSKDEAAAAEAGKGEMVMGWQQKQKGVKGLCVCLQSCMHACG